MLQSARTNEYHQWARRQGRWHTSGSYGHGAERQSNLAVAHV